MLTKVDFSSRRVPIRTIGCRSRTSLPRKGGGSGWGSVRQQMASRFSRTPKITSRARSLRRAVSPIEQRLWHALRGAQLGASFRRQHPVGPYVLDFCCTSLELGVEIDGDEHSSKTARDAARTRFLNCRGVRVIRFTNRDVWANLDWDREQSLWSFNGCSDLGATRAYSRRPPPFTGRKRGVRPQRLLPSVRASYKTPTNVHTRRQEHARHLPGLHRSARHLPLRAGHRLWHAHGRRRDPRQRRHHPSWAARCSTR